MGDGKETRKEDIVRERAIYRDKASEVCEVQSHKSQHIMIRALTNNKHFERRVKYCL